MHSLPSPVASRRTVWSHIFGAALVFGLSGACGEETSGPGPTTSLPPNTCEPESITLRSLDGWSQCCEDDSEPELPRDGTLISCASSIDEIAGGGATGALGGAGGANGADTPPWVVITRPFEAEWDGGSKVCLHMTSNGDVVEGDVALFTLSGAASCQVPTAATAKKFIATEKATAYVCLNQYGPRLASPGPGGKLAVAFRLREGTPEALRVDAIDVHQETCDP